VQPITDTQGKSTWLVSDISGHDLSNSQADSAGSIPVTRSKSKAAGQAALSEPRPCRAWPSVTVRAISGTRIPADPSSPRLFCSDWTCVSIALVMTCAAP